MKMVGEKKKNCYRKRRKGKAFSGVHIHSQASNQSIGKAAEASETVRNESNGDANEATCVSSSRKKMKLQHDAEHPPAVVVDDNPDLKEDEYRLINVKQLASVLCKIHHCEKGIYS